MVSHRISSVWSAWVTSFLPTKTLSDFGACVSYFLRQSLPPYKLAKNASPVKATAERVPFGCLCVHVSEV